MKVYEDYRYTGNDGRIYSENYKAGNVGKSHSVVRIPYYNRSAIARGGDGNSSNIGTSNSGYYYKSDFDKFLVPERDAETIMINRCISKFEGKCGPSGSVGSSVFAEGGKTVQAAVDLLEGFAKTARAMRRKDVKRLKKAWQQNKKATAALKQAGGKWLSWSFGWGPLVSTISDAMAATAADFPKVKVHAVQREFRDRYFVEQRSNTTRFVQSTKGKQSIKIGYDVQVENPNTWLLGRLDLLNPGVWIWEAIPFSFFVDYFININDMIHNLDSFSGLKVDNGYTTYYHDWDCEQFFISSTSSGNVIYSKSNSRGTYIHRTSPTPLKRRLVLAHSPLTSSWRRGLNASSFLAQFLRS
jgi:hypothetical protein